VPRHDVSGRHSRQRFVRLMEQRRTVDGDMFMLKVASGHVQAIEGDRVRTPSHGAPRNMDTEAVRPRREGQPGRSRAGVLHRQAGPGGGRQVEKAGRTRGTATARRREWTCRNSCGSGLRY